MKSEMDLINRRDAIRIVDSIDTWQAGWRGNAIESLKALPSAQPEPCEDAVSRNAIIQKLNTMDRYVSEGLILCDTDKKFPKNEVFIVDDVYEEIVENLTSAQPDIIHCGECKYYDDSDGCFFSTATTGANGFCHWAERKEGEA